MTPTALLLLSTLAGTPASGMSIDKAIRIAACGPSEEDRASLEILLRGATYDHLGGGFHDAPGGPKSLETNAWRLNALIATYESEPDLFVRNMALDTVAFVLRDLKDGRGAFFKSLGSETTTAYYSFTEQEVRAALGPSKAAEFFADFALAPGGFPILTGSPFAGLADTRQTLLLRRLRRPRLPLDDMIDIDSNGIWCAALARAGTVLKRYDFIEAARRAAIVSARLPAGAGSAFGLAVADRLDPGRSAPEVSSKALDEAIGRSQRVDARTLATLAWAIAEGIRARPSDVRSRQLARVVKELETRFPATDSAAAAKCVATTASPAKP